MIGTQKAQGAYSEPQREPHHNRLHYEINRLDETVLMAEALLQKITGGPTPCEDPKAAHVESMPALQDVLMSAADRINDRRCHLQELILQIERALF